MADLNYAPMYAQRTRRVNTNRWDARALAHACSPAPVGPPIGPRGERRHLRTLVAVHVALVRTRAARFSRT